MKLKTLPEVDWYEVGLIDTNEGLSDPSYFECYECPRCFALVREGSLKDHWNALHAKLRADD